ncbi:MULTISPECIES: DegT/DnrJ/EryC1/StrS family aminotransferase [unclassified Solwaraspora]|uniref:DegT/DnrJ/EryC1/StrS family aminotransferase n=1 Tax=unclassified Solwaraspora TaxID=2627926 RepID=UPI00248B9563|nr:MULTISPECIES: DegT/DnrJ/EryC1/StrS family aminotransferase [unclassified Solwaraspora]WBB95746.1 DegT/DnrJ/EryC1/StrS family aminotransferase [Solwaraspora sp. WMMA2059]WBC20350.1 DegT/DnrJ/EryC1/StrS family aminotransferase [Solwaraspora sp. WMMA2080]WJK37499.1 DegT/DnrJ/EryC1/StrS family aminotransferase [Solwaraspora sp. WMMA2065]
MSETSPRRIQVMLPMLGEEEEQAAAAAIRSGWVAQGPRVAQFEREFAAVVGADHGVAVSSCTTALHLALVLHGVGPGDEVVVPSLSFIATANAVRHAGAEPVFADVDLVTGNLTVETIEAVRTPRTRAVIAVHQGGMPFDTATLRTAAAGWGVPLIEDAACAAGSRAYGRPVGAGATVSAWSFHPRKVITTGEGGMLTLDDADGAARLRRLREHGMNVSAADRHASAQPVLEAYLEPAFNYRMTDIQAAVGLVQVGRLAGLVAGRRALAARYHQLLAGIDGLVAVVDPAYGETNFQSFWVRVDPEFGVSRDDVLTGLSDAGVSARRGIMAAHLEPAYADVTPAPLPVTERLTRDSLILPLHHALTEADQDHIVAVLRKLAGR